jgi:hypothetical protein
MMPLSATSFFRRLICLGHVVGALELDDAVIVGGVYRAKGRHFSANVTGAAEQSERMSMGLLLKRGRRDFKLVSHNMAKRLAKLKCRFASNSIPQGYGRSGLETANDAETRRTLRRCA